MSKKTLILLILFCSFQILSAQDKIILQEHYVDSTNIGKKKFDRIDLFQYSKSDSLYVVIKFYSKTNRDWVLKQTFDFDKNYYVECDVKISDFNNDGFKDITYISDVAARSANEVRRLFIYDAVNDKLIYMKNSEDYPNIQYNKTLKCVDAFLMYGGCSTVFLKIRADKLVEFAKVELVDGELIVSENDSKGQSKVIRHDSKTKMYYVRFYNYKPVKPYYRN